MSANSTLQILRRVIVGVVLALAVMSVSACGLLSSSNPCSTDMLAMLSVSPLPPSANVLYQNCSMSFNPTYDLRMTIAPADLVAFQQSTSITNWQTDPAAVTRFEDEAAGMQSLIFGTFGNGAIIQDVLIDTSNPQQYTVIYSASFVD